MSLVVNRATTRLAAFLNRHGLVGVNRFARRLVWRMAGNAVEIEVGGLRISGPAESWRVLSQIELGALEPHEVSLFTDAVAQGAVVLDVGANIGWYTLLAARAAGPSGHVYSFEPDPRTLPSLEQNVRANGFSNVSVIPKAASDASRRQTLYLSRVAGW